MPEPQERSEAHPDGSAKARWHVIAGEDGTEVPHGLFESFHPNGMKAERGLYDHGRRVDTWVAWDETGRQLFATRGEDIDAAPADEPDPASWDEPIQVEESPEQAQRTRLWSEVGVVLCLGWLPFLAKAVLSPDLLWSSEWPNEAVVDDQASTIDSLMVLGVSIQVLIPLLWIAKAGGASWTDMGIARPRAFRDIGLGALIAVVLLLGDLLVIAVLDPTFLGMVFMPGSPIPIAIMCLAMIANSLFEETLWRGYLWHRFKQLLGSTTATLLVTSALFASYHIYQGPAGAFLAFTTGLVFGASRILFKSIWPAIVAHTLYNVYVTLPFAPWPD